MTAPRTSLIHYFDVVAHRILCGVRGVDHRSTKHSHSVNCQACVSLLVKQQSTGPVAAVDAVAR
jgi:hypothetical protein